MVTPPQIAKETAQGAPLTERGQGLALIALLIAGCA